MRECEVIRKTNETDIKLKLRLEGVGACRTRTNCGFFDHMMTLFAGHGKFDLELSCNGDTYVDDHHTVEDIGICLGEAFAEALGDKRGIKRYASVILPMDEALVLCAVDISGRGYLGYDMEIPTQKVGSFDTELVKEFMLAFVRKSGITLHLKRISGENSHHIIEGAFKALARALREAVSIDGQFVSQLPSTKGVL